VDGGRLVAIWWPLIGFSSTSRTSGGCLSALRWSQTKNLDILNTYFCRASRCNHLEHPEINQERAHTSVDKSSTYGKIKGTPPKELVLQFHLAPG